MCRLVTVDCVSSVSMRLEMSLGLGLVFTMGTFGGILGFFVGLYCLIMRLCLWRRGGGLGGKILLRG